MLNDAVLAVPSCWTWRFSVFMVCVSFNFHCSNPLLCLLYKYARKDALRTSVCQFIRLDWIFTLTACLFPRFDLLCLCLSPSSAFRCSSSSLVCSLSKYSFTNFANLLTWVKSGIRRNETYAHIVIIRFKFPQGSRS